MHKLILSSFFSLLALTILGGCTLDTYIKEQTASQIGRPAFMVERYIPAGAFNLNAWERMHERGQTATVYIGDGAHKDLTDGSFNLALIETPTPDNPVALHLASRDQSKNSAFIAQPCQYIKDPDAKGCAPQYWREDRFSPTVMDSFNRALQDMKLRYDLTGFHLVGHGSGANVAGVLAVLREDVLSFRSVAGNLNPDYTIQYHQSTPLSADAMLASNYGAQLATIPQHHFIGAADKLVPPGTYHSYRQALGLTECVSYSIIQDADHDLGWVQLWPQLRALVPSCKNERENAPLNMNYNTPKPMPRELPNFPGNFDK